MRRITMLALVVVLALMGAACGGDDDDSADEDTEATDDGAANEDDGGDGGDDDGGAPDGALSDAIGAMGGCTGAAAAVSASMIAGFNPQAAAQLEENRAFFEDFESSVPDDIKEDVELFASYVEAYADVMAEFDPQDLVNPEKADEITEAFDDLEEDYSSEEIDEASDNINTWFTEECPGLVGS